MKNALFTLILCICGFQLLAVSWVEYDSLSSKSDQLDYLVDYGDKLVKGPDQEVYLKVSKLGFELAKAVNDQRGEIIGFNFKAIYYRSAGKLDSSLILHQEALSIAKKLQEPTLMVLTYNLISIVFFRQARIDEQLKYNDSAATLAKQNELKGLVRMLLFNRSYILSQLGKDKEAFLILIDLYNKLKPINKASVTYISHELGVYYRDHGNLDSAAYFFTEAIQSAIDHNQLISLGSANIEFGLTQKMLGNITAAETYVLRADSIFRVIDNSWEIFYALECIIPIYLAEGKVVVANSAWLELSELAKQLDNLSNWMSVYKLKANIENKEGKFEDALKNQKLYIQFKDSNNSIELKDRVAELEAKYSFRDKEQELDHLKRERALLKKQLYFSYATGMLVFGLIIFLVLYFRAANKNRQLERDKENEKLRFEVKMKEEEVLQKTRQLVSNSMLMSNNIEFLDSLVDTIQNGSNDGEVIKTVLNKIKLNLQSSSDWEEFRTFFEEINPKFIERVFSQYPDLTDREIRLLVFIKLGLNLKEIAHLLHVEQNTIKVARHRLKKKMNLDAEVNISNFVNQL